MEGAAEEFLGLRKVTARLASEVTNWAIGRTICVGGCTRECSF
jgi:hypothetical protein